jgi:hypothetical protein
LGFGFFFPIDFGFSRGLIGLPMRIAGARPRWHFQHPFQDFVPVLGISGHLNPHGFPVGSVDVPDVALPNRSPMPDNSRIE